MVHEAKDFREISNAFFIGAIDCILIYKDGTSVERKITELSSEEYIMVQYFTIQQKLKVLKEMMFSGVNVFKRLDLAIELTDDGERLSKLDINDLINLTKDLHISENQVPKDEVVKE